MRPAVVILGAVVAVLLLRRPSSGVPADYVIPPATNPYAGPGTAYNAVQLNRAGSAVRGVANTIAAGAGAVGGPAIGTVAGLQARISPTSVVGGVVLGPIGTGIGFVKDVGGKAVSAVGDFFSDLF